MKILYLADRRSQLAGRELFLDALRALGEVEIREQCRAWSDEQALAAMREADVLLTLWGARPIPPALAANPGRVRYILHLTGTCREYIPPEVIRSGIAVTNWGDAPARVVAEGALALLLAVVKDLRARSEAVRTGRSGASRPSGLVSGTVQGLRLGLYGCGAIGRRFVELVAPLGPELLVYDPFAEPVPKRCQRVAGVEELFRRSEAVAIHAALTEATRGTVTAELLALLPDHGIVINTARGEIVDQAALFAELKRGRLRAGLDVLAGNDDLPPEHEARQWPNLIWTSHDIAAVHWPPRPPRLSEAEEIALDNLRRFVEGKPLRFRIDERRYALST